jgi:hypothetical protein
VCLDRLAANDVAGAIGPIQTITQLAPGASLSSHLIGLASIRLGEPVRALNAFEHAHSQAPETREHSEALGILHAKLGHLADALYFGKLATAATIELGLPELLPAWLGSFGESFQRITDAPILRQAEGLLAAGRRGEAFKIYQQATELEPRSLAAWRGLAHTALGCAGRAYRPLQGLAASQRLLGMAGATASDRALDAALLAATGQVAEAMPLAAAAAAEPSADAASAYLPIALEARHRGPDEPGSVHDAQAFKRRFCFPLEPLTSQPPSDETVAGRRIRLGVIAGDWGDGDWSQGGGMAPIVPVLAALDPREVELSVYANDPVRGPLSRRAKNRAAHWHDIGRLDDRTLGCIIANDRLDALIDLDGTAGCGRPAIWGNRLARLQLSLYGMAGVAEALGFDGVIEAAVGVVPADLQDQPLPLRTMPELTLGLVGDGATLRHNAEFVADLLTRLPDVPLRLDTERLGGLEMIEPVVSLLPETVATRIEIDPPGRSVMDYFGTVDVLVVLPDTAYPDLAVAAIGLGLPALTTRSPQPRARLLAGWLDEVGQSEWVAAAPADLIERVAGFLDSYAPADRRSEIRARLEATIQAERRDGARRQATRLVRTLRDRLESLGG